MVNGLSMICPQNHWDGLSVVCPPNHWDGFLRFGLKTGGNNFLVEAQNQGGGGFPGLGLKTGIFGLVIWA
jgi:hypothetical protein